MVRIGPMSDAPSRRKKASRPLLRLDPYETSSLLQKAIRRGDADLAERAAVRLYRLRGLDAGRRLLVIAFEDVGIGSLDALIKTTEICVDASASEPALCDAARLLADAPKDRSPKHLLTAALIHPALEEARRVIAAAPHAERLDLVTEADASLSVRAIAAWRCSGLNWQAKPTDRGDIAGLMNTFARLGVPGDLILASREAAKRTYEPIVLMAPLVWIAAVQDQPPPIVEECPLPEPVDIDGVPLSIFDKHTAVGKAAIRRLVHEIEPVRAVLRAFVPKDLMPAVAEMAALHAEATAVSRSLLWRGAVKLETLGVEADMLWAGARRAGIGPIVTTMRDNIEYLNMYRIRVFFGNW
jgi:hypothetical protein